MKVRNKLQTTNYKLQTNTGFSLLETVVAISILMITIVGPLSLASKGIVFADYVQNEITGFYLAQEAMEAIRNIRDSNIKNDGDWLHNIQDECLSADGSSSVPCRIDIWNFDKPNNGLEKIGGCLECGGDLSKFERMKVVNLGDSLGAEKLYGYIFTTTILDGGRLTPEDSIFSRRITITDKTSKIGRTRSDIGIGEINVVVEVSWVSKSGGRTVTVSENMFKI